MKFNYFFKGENFEYEADTEMLCRAVAEELAPSMAAKNKVTASKEDAVKLVAEAFYKVEGIEDWFINYYGCDGLKGLLESRALEEFNL